MAAKSRRKKKKKKTHVNPVEDENAEKTPKSFVFRRGKVGKSVTELAMDFRHLMKPNTATNLKERQANKLKDFVHVAGPLGVTHIAMFSETELGTYLKIGRLPRGPMMTFRIHEYSLAADVFKLHRRPHSPGSEFHHAPLVILNNFNPGENADEAESKSLQLMQVMFQNMFPAINVKTVTLAACRRCILLVYDKETKRVSFRHYVISASPVGLSRPVKKLLKSQVPDLHKYADISEYVDTAMDGGYATSDSEGEDMPESRISLPQNFPGRGNKKSGTSAIRLKEMGPRMELELIKIESGLTEGEVMYHAFIEKTPEEAEALKKRKDKERQLKIMRKKQQQENVERKKAMKEGQEGSDGDGDGDGDADGNGDGDPDRSGKGKKRARSKDARGAKDTRTQKKAKREPKGSGGNNGNDDDDDDDDDGAVWYRKEIGE
eukprot:Rmarinus@m.9567